MIDKQPHEAISRHPYTYKPTQQKNYIICAKLRGDTALFPSVPPSLPLLGLHSSRVRASWKEGRKEGRVRSLSDDRDRLSSNLAHFEL